MFFLLLFILVSRHAVKLSWLYQTAFYAKCIILRVVLYCTASVRQADYCTRVLTASDGRLDFNAFASLMSRSRAKNAEEAKRREEQEMRQAFRVFDIDGNGVIDEKELRTTMKNLGEDLSTNDVKAMIKAADKNGDGKIDYNGIRYTI